MNLVGPGPLEPHYQDCQEALRPLAEASGTWADLGTGAGFPGVVFAARFPQVELDLVDSRRKRCVFLEHVLAEVPTARVRVRCARIEDLPDASYDGLLSRALAPPDEVLTHARRLLRPGGRAVLLLGPAPLAVPVGFSLEFDHAYRSDGAQHRSLGLRLDPRDPPAPPATTPPRP
jgi:16S rRNA (guanine(527)-N(7))-methyltransferase RsmG